MSQGTVRIRLEEEKEEEFRDRIEGPVKPTAGLSAGGLGGGSAPCAGAGAMREAEWHGGDGGAAAVLSISV